MLILIIYYILFLFIMYIIYQYITFLLLSIIANTIIYGYHIVDNFY